MKKTILCVILVLSVLSVCAVNAFAAADNAEMLNENTDYGGNWVIENGVYNCRDRVDWPDFGFYALGNTAEKVRLYMDLTISDKSDEPDGLGGDSGFMVGVSDVNGNGLIEENVDNYYLIDISSSNDGGFLAIEKNVGKWGDWQVIDHSASLQAGAVVGLTVIYDPAEAAIAVYITEYDVNGDRMTEADPWLEWTDTDSPLTGTGFGICSKITDSYFKNVSIAYGENATAPKGDDVKLSYDPNASEIVIADFTDPAVISYAVGTGNDCKIEQDELTGCLKLTVTGEDPFFKVPMNMKNYFDGDKYTIIVLDCKTDVYSPAEIFFTTKEARDISRCHITFDIDETEDFAELEVDMLYDDYGSWTDQIRSIRIDPCRNAEEGSVYYFRAVKAKTEEEIVETGTDAGTETETEAESVTEEATTAEETKAPDTSSNETTKAPETDDQGTKTPENKSSTPLIIGIVIGCVVIIAAVAAIILAKKKKK